MNYISQNFSIRDLERLSGVKAHTIRIWEKRYKILNPDRTNTNIRTYDIGNHQKVLNVTFLNNNGYKISRVAKLSETEISKMVEEVAASSSPQDRAMNSFTLSMINFDQNLFHQTYNSLHATLSFREIFYEVFIPLLNQIGVLWQTNTINPVHEHFLVGLIKQMLYSNIAQVDKKTQIQDDNLYILFLPENEIHDLGILFLDYELNFHGKKTIYLGPSMPIKDMQYLLEIHPDPIFISYLTVRPKEISEFIEEFNDQLCMDSIKVLHLLGRRVQSLDPLQQQSHIKIYKSITEFTTHLA